MFMSKILISLNQYTTIFCGLFSVYWGTVIMADEDTPQDIADRERIFKRFDMNGDGKISSTELGDALKTLGSVTSEEVTRMMAEIDTDGDGFISIEEFTAFARANRGLVRDVAKIF
ncbi:polcalcin Che a 3-like [Silene latifolia]|uniref:polcalcin Che a 3-like n=1 Tax=Silene latifolia TaxID=37657 RepID=UPI003D76A9C4